MPHGIDPFRVPIVAKRPDRSRINVMRQSQQNEPDSRGLDPAIQTRIEMLRFFLDGRVKHGHDEGKILPRFDFSGRDFSRTSRTAINACACDDPLSASQHYAPQCARDDGLG
jgi:hypothetical protein